MSADQPNDALEETRQASAVIWRDPPPSRLYRERKDLTAIAAELRANPGRWALVYESASAGVCRTLKRRGLDVRTVLVDSATKAHDVYARWPEGVA